MQIQTLIKPIFTAMFICSLLLSALSSANEYNFDSLVENIKETKRLAKLPSGTSIIAIKGEKVIFDSHIGYADIVNKIKVTANTPYYIASVTKPFTALNALIDIENKSISSKLTISEMFPEIQNTITDADKIALPQLLSHTSSLDNYPLVLATAYSGDYDQNRLLSLVSNYTVNESQGVGKFKYTNVGYNLYSVFADEYFKITWQDKLKKQLFEPLKLSRTSATRSFFKENQISVAKPYSLMVETLPAHLPLEKQDNTMHAAGGMYASAEDLAKFLIVQLNQGKYAGKQVFPADIIEKSQKKQVEADSSYMDFKRDGYAWGWYTGEYKGQNMLHHFGGFAGTHAHLSFIPEKSLGLVIINNEDFLSARLTSIIADFVYGNLLNEPQVEMKSAKRFESLNQKLAQLDRMRLSQKQKIENRKMILSLPVTAYIGSYKHQDLGVISLTREENNQIRVSWGEMSSFANGFDTKDKMRVTLNPTSGDIIEFIVDDRVQSLNYKGLTFERL